MELPPSRWEESSPAPDGGRPIRLGDEETFRTRRTAPVGPTEPVVATSPAKQLVTPLRPEPVGVIFDESTPVDLDRRNAIRDRKAMAMVLFIAGLMVLVVGLALLVILT